MENRSIVYSHGVIRRLIPLVLVAIVSLAGCGGGASGDSDDSTSTTDASDTSDGGDTGDSTGGNETTDVEVSWERPKERESGEHLMASRIDRYELAYGTESGEYEAFEETMNTSMTLENLERGEKYFFAVRVYDASGRISDLSDEVSRVVE